MTTFEEIHAACLAQWGRGQMQNVRVWPNDFKLNKHCHIIIKDKGSETECKVIFCPVRYNLFAEGEGKMRCCYIMLNHETETVENALCKIADLARDYILADVNKLNDEIKNLHRCARILDKEMNVRQAGEEPQGKYHGCFGPYNEDVSRLR